MNVEFVKVRSANEIEVRFCERGVGETMSSGTGSCAAAVASIHTGKVSSPVRVLAPGGAQTCRMEWRSVSLLARPRCSVGVNFSFKISHSDAIVCPT